MQAHKQKTISLEYWAYFDLVIKTKLAQNIFMMTFRQDKGWCKKKRVHPKFDLTSKCNKSETISQNHLKFGVSRLTIVDYLVINF